MGNPRRNWTAEEDRLLQAAVHEASAQSRPLLWRELAKSVPGRSNKDCRRRWWNSLAGGIAKGPWSEAEDERLIEAVRRCGTRWSQVARMVGSRNSDQCSSHWSQVLDPSINFCDWTPDEDEKLLHAVLSHGTNWATIAASHTPKRTTLALKNRYSTLRSRHNSQSVGASNASGCKTPPAANAADLPRQSRQSGTSRASCTAKSDAMSDDEDDDNDDMDDGDEDDDQVPAMSMSNSSMPTPGFGSPRTTTSNSSLPRPPTTSPEAWNCFNDQDNLFMLPGEGPSLPKDALMQDANNICDPFAIHADPMYAQSSFWEGDMALEMPFSTQGDANLTLFPGAGAPPSDKAPPSRERGHRGPMNAQALQSRGTNHSRSGSTTAVATPPNADSDYYQVSMNVLCTKGQLDSIMGGLAGAGVSVSLKVDRV